MPERPFQSALESASPDAVRNHDAKICAIGQFFWMTTISNKYSFIVADRVSNSHPRPQTFPTFLVGFNVLTPLLHTSTPFNASVYIVPSIIYYLKSACQERASFFVGIHRKKNTKIL
jgi:hypothetical protein